MPFKTIAKRFGTYPEKIRQIYARALRRQRRASTAATVAVDLRARCTTN